MPVKLLAKQPHQLCTGNACSWKMSCHSKILDAGFTQSLGYLPQVILAYLHKQPYSVMQDAVACEGHLTLLRFHVGSCQAGEQPCQHSAMTNMSVLTSLQVISWQRGMVTHRWDAVGCSMRDVHSRRSLISHDCFLVAYEGPNQ